MIIYELIKNRIPVVIAVKQKENGDFLMIESRNLEIFHLNETAKDFILLCDGKKNISDIEEVFVTLYEIDKDVLRKDIVDLVRDLQWKKIISMEE